MPKDILQNSLETMSAMINAAGTKAQIELLNSLKEDTEVLLAAEEDSNIEEFTDVMQKIISILEDPEFDLEFIKNEIRAIRLSLSEMTNKMLKVSVNKTKQILEENRIEEEVEEVKEDKPEAEEVKVESKEKVEETVAAEEVVNETKENKDEEKEMAKTIDELKEKLRKAKEAAAKCDSSTLAKVGKVSLGLAIVAGAAYGGYYYANNYSGRNTTIIINGGDED